MKKRIIKIPNQPKVKTLDIHDIKSGPDMVIHGKDLPHLVGGGKWNEPAHKARAEFYLGCLYRAGIPLDFAYTMISDLYWDSACETLSNSPILKHKLAFDGDVTCRRQGARCGSE
jgi:hypothetical protein